MRGCGREGADVGGTQTLSSTSPNVVAGNVAILFGIGGPSAAVCRGLDGGIEAFEIGVDLIASSKTDLAVIVAVDDLSGIARHMGDAIGARLNHGATAALVVAQGKDALPSTPFAASVQREGHRGLAERLATFTHSKLDCHIGTT